MNVTRLLTLRPTREIDHVQAKRDWQAFRVGAGYSTHDAPLLTPPDANAKMAKSGRPDYALSLAPAVSSGHNVCPFSTPQCRATCVAHTGRGGAPTGASGHTVADARALKVKFLVERPDAFCSLVKAELVAAVAKHGAIGCRLNAFSDLAWETLVPWLLEVPGVKFYDYTKDWARTAPTNYSLTFSASERITDSQIGEAVSSGRNVAVVFSVAHRPGAKVQGAMPTSHLSLPVIDGDKTDTRYDDSRGVIVGLRAKGKAAQLPVGGFVRQAS